MKDLTDGSIAKNILQMAVPIAAGDAAIAGVGAAGNVMFIVFALTQVLGVGTVAAAPIVGQSFAAGIYQRVRMRADPGVA